jgi:decaprenylphospho-beta-D-erythro-pentofuranosid-2-ulose 2-reductase
MINGLGQPQRLLVVGASSDIAAASVRAIAAAGGVESALLTARDPGALGGLQDELQGAGIATSAASWDATGTPQATAAVVERAWEDGDVDVVLIAVGELPDQAEVEADPALVTSLVQTNLTGPACLALYAAQRLRAQGHGTLVVLSSVAAERPRASNFAYAATKAGLDSFASGLADSLAGDGVQVLVVRPGFVHSKMTAGLDPAPLATTPERVGADIARSVAARRSGPIWSPGAVRVLTSALRHLPRPLYRRVSRGR